MARRKIKPIIRVHRTRKQRLLPKPQLYLVNPGEIVNYNPVHNESLHLIKKLSIEEDIAEPLILVRDDYDDF